MKFKVTKCQYCGSKNLGVGYHFDEASILNNNSGLTGSKVIYTICRECGSIVHSRVVASQIFTKNAEDEEE
jgi:DNA-directed RNA polymerase subunit RPC12/RpoP